MFLEPDARSVPPPWEPPRKTAQAKRAENAATWLIVLISMVALFAPIAGGSMIAMGAALVRAARG